MTIRSPQAMQEYSAVEHARIHNHKFGKKPTDKLVAAHKAVHEAHRRQKRAAEVARGMWKGGLPAH